MLFDNKSQILVINPAYENSSNLICNLQKGLNRARCQHDGELWQIVYEIEH